MVMDTRSEQETVKPIQILNWPTEHLTFSCQREHLRVANVLRIGTVSKPNPNWVTHVSLLFSVELAGVQACQSKANIEKTKNYCTVQLATCNTNKKCRKLDF